MDAHQRGLRLIPEPWPK